MKNKEIIKKTFANLGGLLSPKWRCFFWQSGPFKFLAPLTFPLACISIDQGLPWSPNLCLWIDEVGRVDGLIVKAYSGPPY